MSVMFCCVCVCMFVCGAHRCCVCLIFSYGDVAEVEVIGKGYRKAYCVISKFVTIVLLIEIFMKVIVDLHVVVCSVFFQTC